MVQHDGLPQRLTLCHPHCTGLKIGTQCGNIERVLPKQFQHILQIRAHLPAIRTNIGLCLPISAAQVLAVLLAERLGKKTKADIARREYEMLRLEFEQTLANNEQSGPLTKVQL